MKAEFDVDILCICFRYEINLAANVLSIFSIGLRFFLRKLLFYRQINTHTSKRNNEQKIGSLCSIGQNLTEFRRLLCYWLVTSVDILKHSASESL